MQYEMDREYDYEYGDEIDMNYHVRPGMLDHGRYYGHHGGFGRHMTMRPPSPKRPKYPPQVDPPVPLIISDETIKSMQPKDKQQFVP